jgi:hypothetical protein
MGVCTYVFMYIRMYLCTYVCIYYIHIYVCIYIHTHVSTYVRMYVCVYVCVYACMYVCMYICMYMYVCMYVCTWNMLKSKQRISEALFLTCARKAEKIRDLFISYLCRANKTASCSNALNWPRNWAPEYPLHYLLPWIILSRALPETIPG